MDEREIARQLSAQIDRLLDGQAPSDAAPAPLAKEMEAARQIQAWNERLPPPPPALQRRVAALVAAADRSTAAPRSRHRTWRAAVWSALTTAALLLLVWMIVPSGQQVWAQIMRIFLGQTTVEPTATLEIPSRQVREPLRDLVAAELTMGRAPSVPRTLPEGYVLSEIAAVSYPDMPSWISQPFFIELAYGREGEPPDLYLREYRLLFRDYGGITGFEPASELVAVMEEVDVGGVDGAMLTLIGDPPTYCVIWERDGLLLELETARLSPEALLQVARAVR